MTKLSIAITIPALLLQTAVSARPADGPLRVMPMGSYACSLPGDATGPARQPIEGSEFSIASASRYVSAAGNGTYLLSGERLVFTRGPMNGMRFMRTSETVLQEIDADGQRKRMRCDLITRR